MPTLYVENVPEDLYEALRARAKSRRKSIAAEVIDLIAAQVPTRKEMARRRKILESFARIRAERPPSPGPFPTVEEMLREDRSY
jgi:plasmid stability protein